MRAALDRFLTRFIRAGRLTVVWPDGTSSQYGDPDAPHPAGVRFADDATVRRMLNDPALGFGEAYVDGRITAVGGPIHDALDLLMLNLSESRDAHHMLRLRRALGRWARQAMFWRPPWRARRDVAHHYDLSGRLFSLFLDRDRQYSCAYFPTGEETLDEAQAAKKRHVAAKLCLDRPGLSVLDIGSGWGGLALTLARDYGAHVTGITLSSEQLAESRARAAAEGLADRVRFELLDFAAVRGQYDRVVSVGMFEHVGAVRYADFFATLARVLRPDGVALLHAIGRSDGPASTNPWLEKYVFPGGYCPALSEVLPRVERARLIATDIEILRLHYVQTVRLWRRRFAANRDAIASLLDERFCRMWEFYLACAEIAFRRQNHMVFQLQLARRQDAVPLTRDYIGKAEAVRTGAPAAAPAAR